MSDFKRCALCKEYGWIDDPSSFLRHVCKPRWECRLEWQDDDEWDDVHAESADRAAEKFAERYDCDGGDYAIVSNRHKDDVVVLVRKDEDGPVKRFAIEAETVPTYSATEISETIG